MEAENDDRRPTRTCDNCGIHGLKECSTQSASRGTGERMSGSAEAVLFETNNSLVRAQNAGDNLNDQIGD